MAGDTDRRTFLRAGGAAAGGAALPGVAPVTTDAQLDELHLGRQRFVEVTLAHDGAPSFPIAHSYGRVPHVVDRGGGRVGLTAGAVAPFLDGGGGGVIASNDGYRRRTDGPTVVHGGASRQLPLDVHASGAVTRSLVLEEPYACPDIAVEPVDGDRSVVKAGDVVVDVGPGREESVALPARTVAVRRLGDSYRRVENPRPDGPETVRVREPGPVEEISVTPRVTVRDHGVVDVYGGEDVRVLLPRSRSGYAERRRAAIRASLPDAATDRVGDGLVAVGRRS